MEKAISFALNQQHLLGILHQPRQCHSTGVLVVVGGPQYRVGSHRQFVQLSRALAAQGIASMRFDYRGMGDSEGDKQAFDGICDDIRVAVDAFCAHSGLNRVVIWGLCDAASAAMIYAHKDNRVKGLVLLNPWLRNQVATGKTMLRYYYLQRLFSRDFWHKLLKGRVKVGASFIEAKGFVKSSVVKPDSDREAYPQRMENGLSLFKGQVCFILSGNDLTAKEFEQIAMGKSGWSHFSNPLYELKRMPTADHTFSNSPAKKQVEEWTVSFLMKLV